MVEPLQFDNVDRSRRHSPLMQAALAMLEAEAQTSRDAYRLLRHLEELPNFCWQWYALEVLHHFDSEDGVMARPVLMAVLLNELAAAFPVPMMLLQ